MTGEAAFEFVFDVRILGNIFLVTSLAILMGGRFIGLDLLVHPVPH